MLTSSYNDTNYVTNDSETHPCNYTTSLARTQAEEIVIELGLCSLIFVVICGNLLVCVTIITDRKLHSTTNYFILSLAVTDLLLGCLILPVSAYNAVSSHWPLGSTLCNAYVSSDVMLCTVSILTLFAISLDRYFAVVVPLRYHQTMRR